MEPTKRVPPYLPFKTFLSSLDALSHGVPPKIDRTLWRSQSGVTQGLIMNTYRFFALVEDDDESDSSSGDLEQMAKHPDKRPEILRSLIEAQYWEILQDHDLTKMTLKMLDSAFEKAFSVSGGTKQKAITFFLKAARFASMPLSPYLSSMLRTTRRRRNARVRLPENANAEPGRNVPAADAQIAKAASTHSVQLISGGRLTVSIAADPFKMSQEDRHFVFSIVDQLKKYEKDNSELIPLPDDSEEQER